MSPKRKPWERMSVDEKLEAIREDAARRADLLTVATLANELSARLTRIGRHLGLVPGGRA